MRIIFFRVIIIAFWLLMNGWLLRHEIFPERFSESMGGYQALLRKGPLILDSWMQIESQNSPIGYSHTWVDTSFEYNETAYTVRNQTMLNFKIMGQKQWIVVSADAVLDDQYCLQNFSAVMYSSLYTTRVEGKRIKNGFFNVSIKTPADTKSYNLEIPEDVVIYSSMIEMAMRRLNPGQSLRLKTMDPLSLTVADVVIEAVRREKIVHDDRQLETTLLKIDYQGMTINSWIDDDGRILRQETPFGWTLRAASPREILSRRRQSFDGAELFASLSVPLNGKLTNPRACKRLKVRLNGHNLDLKGLASHRQFVEERTDNAIIMELAAQSSPTNISRLHEQTPPDLRRFLEATSAIQSDHSAMIKQAKNIIAGATNRFEAATKIYEWVYRNIVKHPTVSLPSALDVLQRREGDCNEHTYLFVALARAAGLPAQINVGIVFAETGADEGAFYYHAWPAVYVGEWIEMDPTLGIPLVDATYIRLLTGEIGDQMKLLGLLGKISMDMIWQK